MLTIFLFVSILIVITYCNHLGTKKSPLVLETKRWTTKKENESKVIEGLVMITNPHSKMEVMVPNFEAKAILLGDNNLSDITVKTEVKSLHVDLKNRSDNYWQAYIVKSKSDTSINIKITLKTNSDHLIIDDVESIWVEFNWINYGPFGRLKRKDGLIIPLVFPKKLLSTEGYLKEFISNSITTN